ncbi:MAG: radical SAM protein [Acidobacteriota bacterium]|nr:radical SAM protein [Acidobacteriota bacterium]
MSLGLSQKFSILEQSPYDADPAPTLESEPQAVAATRWVPSRYNVRATTGDGRLVLWNSYAGTMSVFDVAQRSAIEGMLRRQGFAAAPEGAVKYLHDRGFLIKEGTDEYRRIQLGFGQQHYRTDILQLILLASEDCNFRCQYCYEEFARGTMQPRVRSGIKKLVEKRIAGLRNLSISWFGGEPLYGFPAIEELAPFFLAAAEEHNLKFSSNMTTNGYLLTPEVADKLFAWNIRSFQITVDGPPDEHDRNRPTRDGQGSFAAIYENLEALHRRADDFAIDLRFNFDRQSGQRAAELLGLFESAFSGDTRFKLRFRPIGKWGGPNDAQLNVCGTDEAASLQLEMKREARKRGLSLADDIVHVQGLGAQVCYAARPYNFIIGATGKLMKCTIDLDMHDRNVIGQLTDEGDMEIDRDKFALWTEPAFEKDTQCQKCVILPACQGVFCPQIRIEHGISPCSPLRSSAKKEILEAVESSAHGARRVAVEGGSRRPVTAPPPTSI